MMNEPQWQKELLQPLKMQGLVDIKDASLMIRFKFTARPKNPSMIQRMAIRRMYEQLPKLGIRFATPLYQMGLGAAYTAGAGMVPNGTSSTAQPAVPEAANVPPKAAE